MSHTITRTQKSIERRHITIELDPEVIEAKPQDYGYRGETRQQMPVRLAKLELRQTIEDGVVGKVTVILVADRLKKDGMAAKTGETRWELPESRSYLWNIKRTFTDEGIDRLFELREYALKEWATIDWATVTPRSA